MIDQSQESKFRKFHFTGPRLRVCWCFNSVIRVFAQFCWSYKTLCVWSSVFYVMKLRAISHRLVLLWNSVCFVLSQAARQPDRKGPPATAFSLVEISEKRRPNQSYGYFLKRRWLDISPKKPASQVSVVMSLSNIIDVVSVNGAVITANTGFVCQDSTDHHTPHIRQADRQRSFWDWTHLQLVWWWQNISNMMSWLLITDYSNIDNTALQLYCQT